MVNQGNMQQVGSVKDSVAVDKSTTHDGVPTTAPQGLGSFSVGGDSPQKCNLRPGDAPKSEVPEANEALAGFGGFRGRDRAGMPGTGRIDATDGGKKVDIQTKGRVNSGNVTVA